MTPPDIMAVLFDVDGTLVDTWDLYIEAYLQTLEHYHGRRLTLEELRTIGPSSEIQFLERAVGAERMSEAHHRFLETYLALHVTHFGGVYEGVSEALERLRGAGVPVGVVTGKSRRAWEVTEHHQSLGAFAVVVTDDDVSEPKPAPEGIVLAIDALAIPAANAVYVGDGVVDAGAARAAGALFAAAMWSKSAEETDGFVSKVRAAGAWREFATPAALVDAVLAHVRR